MTGVGRDSLATKRSVYAMKEADSDEFITGNTQGSYSNKEIKFQYIPVYSRMGRTKFPGHF